MGRRGRPSNRLLAATQSQYCSYIHRICLNPKIEGQRYCIQHILEDRRAPFRHCTYVHSGRRCNNAANKVERGQIPLCDLHRRPAKPDPTLQDEPAMDQLIARTSHADSDTESIDQGQDTFRYASVYTEEEAARILRDKMMKLRILYIEQFQHLKYLLKEKRLQYVQAHQRDASTSDSHASGDSPKKDRQEHLKLRAMLRYHKLYGGAALLDQKSRKQNPVNPPQVCIFSKTSVQPCSNTALPLSPYCRQHILFDKSQVLFRPCAGGNPPCLTPVISFTRKNTCILHSKFNPEREAQVQVTAPVGPTVGPSTDPVNTDIAMLTDSISISIDPVPELIDPLLNNTDVIIDPATVTELAPLADIEAEPTLMTIDPPAATSSSPTVEPDSLSNVELSPTQ